MEGTSVHVVQNYISKRGAAGWQQEEGSAFNTAMLSFGGPLLSKLCHSNCGIQTQTIKGIIKPTAQYSLEEIKGEKNVAYILLCCIITLQQ